MTEFAQEGLDLRGDNRSMIISTPTGLDGLRIQFTDDAMEVGLMIGLYDGELPVDGFASAVCGEADAGDRPVRGVELGDQEFVACFGVQFLLADFPGDGQVFMVLDIDDQGIDGVAEGPKVGITETKPQLRLGDVRAVVGFQSDVVDGCGDRLMKEADALLSGATQCGLGIGSTAGVEHGFAIGFGDLA